MNTNDLNEFDKDYLCEIGLKFWKFNKCINEIEPKKENDIESSENIYINQNYNLNKPSSDWRKGEEYSVFDKKNINQKENLKPNIIKNFKKQKELTEKVNNIYFKKNDKEEFKIKNEFESNNIKTNFDNYSKNFNNIDKNKLLESKVEKQYIINNINDIREKPKYNKINFNQHQEIFIYDKLEKDFDKNKKDIKINNYLIENNKKEDEKIKNLEPKKEENINLNKFNGNKNKFINPKLETLNNNNSIEKKKYPNPVLIEFNKNENKTTEKKIIKNNRFIKPELKINNENSKILEDSYANKNPIIITIDKNNEVNCIKKSTKRDKKNSKSSSKIKKYIDEDKINIKNDKKKTFKNKIIDKNLKKKISKKELHDIFEKSSEKSIEKSLDNIVINNEKNLIKNKEEKEEEIKIKVNNKEINNELREENLNQNKINNDNENINIDKNNTPLMITNNFLNSKIMKKLFFNVESKIEYYNKNNKNISSNPNNYNKKDIEFLSFDYETDKKGLTKNFLIKEEYSQENDCLNDDKIIKSEYFLKKNQSNIHTNNEKLKFNNFSNLISNK